MDLNKQEVIKQARIETELLFKRINIYLSECQNKNEKILVRDYMTLFLVDSLKKILVEFDWEKENE